MQVPFISSKKREGIEGDAQSKILEILDHLKGNEFEMDDTLRKKEKVATSNWGIFTEDIPVDFILQSISSEFLTRLIDLGIMKFVDSTKEEVTFARDINSLTELEKSVLFERIPKQKKI